MANRQRVHEPAYPDGGSRSVGDNIEAFVGSGRNEIACEYFECLFTYFVRMFAVRVSLPKPMLTDCVRNIQDMKLVGDVSLSYQDRIQLRNITVFTGKSRTTERSCRRMSTMCGPIAARSRADRRAKSSIVLFSVGNRSDIQ